MGEIFPLSLPSLPSPLFPSHPYFSPPFVLPPSTPPPLPSLVTASCCSLFSRISTLAFTSPCCPLTTWLFSTISLAVITCMQMILEFLPSVQTLHQSSPIFQFSVESFHWISHKYLKFTCLQPNNSKSLSNFFLHSLCQSYQSWSVGLPPTQSLSQKPGSCPWQSLLP